MRLVRTEDAVGHVLCHDMTQIVTGEESDGPRFKGPRFRKGHVVAPEDVPVLLSMGKRSLYVWELEPGMVHEDDAAERMVALVAGPGTRTSGAPSEGKINVLADRDGVLLVDSARLSAVNAVDEVMVATRRGGFPVWPRPGGFPPAHRADLPEPFGSGDRFAAADGLCAPGGCGKTFGAAGVRL